MQGNKHSERVAIDVGGTFTDVVQLTPENGKIRFEKVPTTPSEPTKGVLEGFKSIGTDYAHIGTFNHGTTLALNSLLTRTGAKIALVSTKGFRDVFLLGRTNRDVVYDIKYHKPIPLLQRSDTFEVTERMLFDGSVKTPLDVREAERLAKNISELGYKSVVIAFLHSYINPKHEEMMRDIFHKVDPSIEVSCSYSLAREYREYERTSTAVLDAYIKPIIYTYLHTLEEELHKEGFAGEFLMSRSGGGAMTVTAAREQPVNLILSGPAGGVVGAAAFSKMVKAKNLITIDMGGTSLDASIVLDGTPLVYQGAQFEGMPMTITSLNISTIGAGGGSIAWLDDAKALQVGPQSAGADPGPAAYGKGGKQPTFTDAALVIGYLGTDTPLGGKMRLDREKAVEVLQPIAQALNIDVTTLALGIVHISITKIIGAVRAITVELGLDPKDFALLAFGGAGGLVAVDVARELNIPTVIIPPGQGAFCALGMLMADVQHDYARTYVTELEKADVSSIAEQFKHMESEAMSELAKEGFNEDHIILKRTLDARYQGQEHSVNIPCPDAIGKDFRSDVTEAFEEQHDRQFGHKMEDPVEITALRLSALGIIDKPNLPILRKRNSQDPKLQMGIRKVYVRPNSPEDYALARREDLLAGDVLNGPCVLTEHTATTVFHDNDRLEVGEHGELVIKLEASK